MSLSGDHYDDEPVDPANAAADAVAAKLLDDAAGDDVSQPSPVSQLPAGDRRRIADLFWLHSLLQQVLHRDAVARDRRVTRACLAIRDEATRQVQPATQGQTSRSRWLVTSVAVAALVLVAVFMRGTQGPPQQAVAAVQSTLREMQSGGDRMYHVDMEWRLSGDSPAAHRTGDLWVRGNTHYLLRQQGPLGELFLGSNGKEHWAVAALGPVIVSNQPRRFEQLLEAGSVATPYLQVTSMLTGLADRYELTLADEADLPATEGQGTVRCTHVIGRKRDAGDLLSPDVIELWTARQSGIAYRIEARWTSNRGGPQKLQLQLMPPTAPPPSDWYDHASHHTPDRRVIQRGSASTADEL
jgi:hypothetical protein